MNSIGAIKTKIVTLIAAHKLIVVVLVLAILTAAGYKYFFTSKTTAQTYQTAVAQKGMLISSITASGTITSGDTTYITTGATGVVSKVYIKNGDVVKKDQKIAEIDLDDDGKLNQITAWNNYELAQVAAKNSKTSKSTAQITLLQKQQALADAETAQRDSISGGWNPDTKRPYTQNELDIVAKQYPQAKEAYEAALKSYQIADSNISLSNAKVSEAYRNYQKVSATIFAPASGVVNNLVLAQGVVLTNSNSSSTITVSTGTDAAKSSSSVSSQKIGAIKNPEGVYQATVNLTEVDVTKVQSGQKVTITIDAFPDVTLTGTVLAVNTSGSVNSGVTSYSASILLDKADLDIYTNMALSAQIITASIDNVIMIPTVAIKTNNGQKTVQILKDKKVETVVVETGAANDTQTIIKSGINEGDEVITSASTTTKNTSTSTGNSLFGGGSGGMRMQL